ncbi:hypothetical protein KI688_001057 [Linnemannia hyalina]|uniref:BTB domain-containing protein n=1 Tax=Linnemannia hyalina TaxID=64524 RepID=A0A9P7Y5A9_9FUNG|nr:hypothetical protein KI688_001057 [Linnemannia hyalina]
MPPAMASSQLEMTISVFSPRLTNMSSSHNIVIGAGAGWSVGAWNVILRRSVSFHEESVLIGDKYDFDVVFSTEAESLRRTPAPAPVCVIKPKSVPQPNSASREKSLISLLLKDPSSVDVCFISTHDKLCSSIGLWAHRFVLSQHASFAKAIQDAITVQSLSNIVITDTKSAEDVDSDLESTSNLSVDTAITEAGAVRGMSVGAASKELFIKVDTISLATICVVLYYIYIGEINRTVDATRFVLSDTNKVSLVWRDSAGKVEDSVNWRPLGQDSPWRLKDVTWNELRGAAVHFGLKDLQVIAELNLSSLNSHSSIQTTSTAVSTTPSTATATSTSTSTSTTSTTSYTTTPTATSTHRPRLGRKPNTS